MFLVPLKQVTQRAGLKVSFIGMRFDMENHECNDTVAVRIMIIYINVCECVYIIDVCLFMCSIYASHILKTSNVTSKPVCPV